MFALLLFFHVMLLLEDLRATKANQKGAGGGRGRLSVIPHSQSVAFSGGNTTPRGAFGKYQVLYYGF
jgi:hypothetical protein